MLYRVVFTRIFQGLPSEFHNYMYMVKSLAYDEEPDYTLLRDLFNFRLNELNREFPHQPSRLDWLVNVPDKFKDIIDPTPTPFDLYDRNRPFIADR